MPNRDLRRGPTESDVAAAAGVSQSAVSRAFTPGASIAPGKRKLILEAAARLGFHTNLMARSLATRHSNIVALAVSSLENPFYVQVVKELSGQLRDSGRNILLFTAPPESEADPALERVLSYQVDALILTATTASPELAAQCQRAGVPIVQINRDSELAGVSTVRGENRLAGARIAAFLMAGGHRRFGFVGGTEQSGISRARREGYEEYLSTHGVRGVGTAPGGYTFEGAAAAARTLLAAKARPDAIFCASDYMAFAVLDVARREFGLTVPEQLSVVGFDDVPEASRPEYNLTTYAQPAAALVAEAIKIIDQRLNKPGTRALRREVRGDLIVRGSARVPRSGVEAAGGRLIWHTDT